MKLLPTIASLFVLPALLGAAELAPEISLLALRHDADIHQLEQLKLGAVAKARGIYFGALALEEREAMSESKMPVVRAIAKERGAIQSGVANAVYPADFPKTLLADRRKYFETLDRIAAEGSLRQGRIDTLYLRNLAAAETRLGKNPALMAQIASEKERIAKSHPAPAESAETTPDEKTSAPTPAVQATPAVATPGTTTAIPAVAPAPAAPAAAAPVQPEKK